MLSKFCPMRTLVSHQANGSLCMRCVAVEQPVWRPPAPLTTAPKARSPTQCYNHSKFRRNDSARVSKIHGVCTENLSAEDKGIGLIGAMIALLWLVWAILASPFKSKCRLELENATLRHQLMVLRRARPDPAYGSRSVVSRPGAVVSATPCEGGKELFVFVG